MGFGSSSSSGGAVSEMSADIRVVSVAPLSVPVGPAGDKKWEARNVRDADAEAPAGGLSSSVNDMAKFVRLHLANGTFEGLQIIDPAALQVTRVPHMDLDQPTNPAVRTTFYGLGWNVSSDDQGRVRMNHSGAFDSGASTNVALVPGEQVGIVALTIGRPQGVPEAINNAFFDAVQNGQPTWPGCRSGRPSSPVSRSRTLSRHCPGAPGRPTRPHRERSRATPAPTTTVTTFGGTKQSGLGREGSRVGIEEFVGTNTSPCLCGADQEPSHNHQQRHAPHPQKAT